MQRKILYPSGDHLDDYLVMSVRSANAASPLALSVTGAAQLWLVAEGDGYALFTRNAAGEAVRLEHKHGNLELLGKLDESGSSLTHNGKKLAYYDDLILRVRSVNNAYPDVNGNVTLSGLVKTINGKAPDANGNVNVDVTASGASNVLILPVPNDADGDRLHLIVEFSASLYFFAPVQIDTRSSRVGVFGSDQYESFPAAGVGVGYYGSRVLIDRPETAKSMKFVRCRWFDGTDYTPWRAL